mmetsp:Transcript_21460/g.55233  ORF Transcript_21460/g.55233 Transcript_21460/m.55233 type:complete len:327 (-) Transcript_21460:288-1268(-)
MIAVVSVACPRCLMEGDGGRRWQRAQLLQEPLADLVEVLGRVQVLHVRRRDVQLEVRRVVLEVVVVGQLVGHILAQGNGRLIRPAARHIADRVPTAAKHERRQIEAEHKIDARRVPLDRHVEAPQPIARERVGTALQHHRVWLESVHDLLDHGLEDVLVRHVVDPVAQREVDRVVLPRARAHILHVARAGEVLAKLVERARHHAVGGVEGLLHAVAVVDVDVDVQHARVVLEQLEDREHDVVHVAEAGRLALLRVVQPARPVDCYVRLSAIELHCATNRAARRDLAELVHAIEHRAVLAHIESLELLGVVAHVVRRDHLEEGRVLI